MQLYCLRCLLYTSMTAATKVICAKLARAILPCTASGAPPPRKAAAAAVVTAAASTPTETVARGNVFANRDRARPTVTSGDVEVTVDIEWFLSLIHISFGGHRAWPSAGRS